MAPFDPAEVPGAADADLSSHRVWISAGAHDPIVPAESTRALIEMLRAAGAEVEAVAQPGAHQLTQGDLDGLAAWFASW